jgi:hypothetical protein
MKKNYNLFFGIFLICQLFIAIPSYAQNWLWAISAGQTGDDVSYSVATDKNGNVYITGYFKSSTISFGNITLFNTGNADIFVVKYDINGNVIWARSAGGTDEDVSYSIATDNSGNVYITGYFRSNSITFGANVLTNSNTDGSADIFLVKFDTNGNVIWVRSADGASIVYGNSVATYNNSYVYITGRYWSNTITFGSYTLTNNGGYDIFLVKYDSLGTVMWAKSFGKYDHDEGYGVTTDKNANIFLTGTYMSNSITFGSFTLNNLSTSMSDIFIVKCDSLGNIIWANNIGGTSVDELTNNSIATDDSNNVYITGFFSSNTITLGTNTLTNMGGNDFFIAKFNQYGDVKWARSAGGSDWDEGKGVSIDKKGNVWVCGFYGSPSITFGSTTLPNAGTNDLFIVQYDSIGTVKWADRVGISGPEISYDLVTDINDDVYVTGSIATGIVSFGPYSINNSSSGSNAFLAKLSKAVSISEFDAYKPYILTYPNPSDGKFIIKIINNNTVINNLSVEIYNIYGEKVYSTLKLNPSSESEWSLDVSNLETGIYFLNAHTQKENISSVIEITK